MKKASLILVLAATLTALPVRAAEMAEKDGVEAEVQEVTLVVNGSQVRVANAEGKTLEIFNLAGVRVSSVKIDSEDKTFNLNLPKGYYILKVGGTARKVSIR